MGQDSSQANNSTPDESQRLANAQRGDGLAILLVIYFLGAFALLGLIGALILTYRSLTLPQSTGSLLTPLFTLVGSAVGGLGSLLASTRSTPVQAQIVNTPAQPVNVKEADQDKPASTDTMTVAPATATVAAKAAQTFTATGNTGALKWSVQENGTGGTINTDTGEYTAPASEGMDTVVAADQGDMSKMATATVTVTP